MVELNDIWELPTAIFFAVLLGRMGWNLAQDLYNLLIINISQRLDDES